MRLWRWLRYKLGLGPTLTSINFLSTDSYASIAVEGTVNTGSVGVEEVKDLREKKEPKELLKILEKPIELPLIEIDEKKGGREKKKTLLPSQ